MIKKISLLGIAIGILAFSHPTNTLAQNKKNAPPRRQAPQIQMDYEASPAFPFGRLNPKAPPETKQFDFMIGEFDCNDRIINPANKKWFKFKAVRRAAYILNGYAIHDQNWTPILNSTNIRSFNPKAKVWEVTYFKYPRYFTGVWKGGMEGDKMVVHQGSSAKGSRLSFFDINKDGYSWKSERMVEGKPTINWEFICKRRR